MYFRLSLTPPNVDGGLRDRERKVGGQVEKMVVRFRAERDCEMNLQWGNVQQY